MAAAPEFSRPIRLDTLAEAPRRVSIEADEAERAALAARFGLIAVDRLTASAELSRRGADVLAEGVLEARVIQACVASGVPVPATIAEPFALHFVPEAAGPIAEEVELAETELDVIGCEGGAIDLGEAVAQTLALALDPFPRAPGADVALREAGVLGEGETGPFAALKALRDRLRN